MGKKCTSFKTNCRTFRVNKAANCEVIQQMKNPPRFKEIVLEQLVEIEQVRSSRGEIASCVQTRIFDPYFVVLCLY